MAKVYPEVTFDMYNAVVAFGRHMVDAEGWNARALLEYLEKPWKWTEERAAWCGPSLRDHVAHVDEIRSVAEEDRVTAWERQGKAER